MMERIERGDAAVLEEIECNLCGSASRRVIRVENSFPICRCRACGFIYVSPRPASIPGTDYWPNRDAGVSQKPSFEALKAMVYEHGLDALERRLPDKGRLLDVGCAFGVFIERAAQRGWDSHGCDVWAAAVQYAREVKGLPNVQCADAGAYPSNWFQASTLWNVLDHTRDPQRMLQEVARVLVPGAVIMVRVPNMLFHDAVRRVRPLLPARRRERYRYLAGMTPPTRLFGFAPTTLARMLERAGFESIEVAPALHYREQPGRLVDVIEGATSLVYRASGTRVVVSPAMVAFARASS